MNVRRTIGLCAILSAATMLYTCSAPESAPQKGKPSEKLEAKSEVLSRKSDVTAPKNLITDKELLDRVANAVEQKIETKELVEFVGVKPTINTCERGTIDIFERIGIVFKESADHPIPHREDRKDVVYWVRDVPSTNPKIVGIFYLKDGTLSLFEGEVLPPE
ncbi:MAG: hypothetical protein L6R28_18295 [Planctomycetes bacterium]|nr:hypothetical protein [Planctomycetota bacterium]